MWTHLKLAVDVVMQWLDARVRRLFRAMHHERPALQEASLRLVTLSKFFSLRYRENGWLQRRLNVCDTVAIDSPRSPGSALRVATCRAGSRPTCVWS